MTLFQSDLSISLGGIKLSGLSPLIDGNVPDHQIIRTDEKSVLWQLDDGSRFECSTDKDRLSFRLFGFSGEKCLASLGLRFGQVSNVRQYLRNGYMSWDGSYFVQPDNALEAATADPTITEGYAATALLPHEGDGATIIGFLRHDRYQSRFGFELHPDGLALEIETLIDRTPFSEEICGEPLTVFADKEVEPALRRWAAEVAAHSPVPPRLPDRRITGWCSWYNLYASLDEPVLREHLDAAARFRDQFDVPLELFQIDDGFTPEMGDWLDFKPQFPNGVAPLMREAADRGFTPGLWIAPFMVGNRSRLYAEHPDWVVRDVSIGEPLSPMTFYGEFRWHKRSEEYYVLDITQPNAEAYIRSVFRTWAREWGCGYFKADFLHLGSTYGPDRARWHTPGLSRMEIWMKMIRAMREEIGEAILCCCGSPIWAPIGYADAMRIGRDVGVTWTGHYSAQSLLRDQTARNFANGILWQSDPDCILLRDRFHNLTADQISSLTSFAGLSGGVLMTSDQLDEVPDHRRTGFAEHLRQRKPKACDFPALGSETLHHTLGTSPQGKPMMVAQGDPVLIQRVVHPDGGTTLNVFNTGGEETTRIIPWSLFGSPTPIDASENGKLLESTKDGISVTLRPYASRQITTRKKP